jgi:hypothetical protein
MFTKNIVTFIVAWCLLSEESAEWILFQGMGKINPFEKRDLLYLACLRDGTNPQTKSVCAYSHDRF